jgi:hypothetical protein
LPQALAAPAQEPPNSQYITIGSVLGCLVLMTIVAVSILFSTRRRQKPFHFVPTQMSTIPTSMLTLNPHQQNLSSRVAFSPQQTNL